MDTTNTQDPAAGQIDPLRICVAGVSGATGGAVASAVDADQTLALVASVSRSRAGETIYGAPVYGTVGEALRATPIDVLVEFTHPAAAFGHARLAVESGVHVVLGTSGVAEPDLDRLDALALEHGVGVVTAGNLSPLVAAIIESVGLLASHTDGWEVIEYGDVAKRDAPGTTARDLARRLAGAKESLHSKNPSETIGDPNARGAAAFGTQLHSVRLPGFLASFDLIMSTEYERVMVRYEPTGGMEPFVHGTLIAIRAVIGCSGLRRGLN